MKLRVFIMFVALIFIGQICCSSRAYPGDVTTYSLRPGILEYGLFETTPGGDEIRLKYQAVLKGENTIGRNFTITVISHDNKVSLLGDATKKLELSESFKNFFKDRDKEASYMIELLYPSAKDFYSRLEVLQGHTTPQGMTAVHILKVPTYSDFGKKISDIRNGVLIKVQSVCTMMVPKLTILQILTGDFAQTPFHRTECVDVNRQTIISGAMAEISSFASR